MRLARLILLAAGLLLPGAAAAEGFPAVVRHALGSTLIERRPARIVTLGWSGEDAVLALGETPVAMPRYRFFESGMFPWNEARLGDARPLLMDGEIDYEAIAVLRPDLILGVYSGIDALAYARLSAIAPTVVYRSGPWEADWKEQAEITGEALGKPAEARALVEAASATLARLGAEQPALKGRTFTFGTYFPGAAGMVVYLPNDPRVAALTALGLKPAPGVLALSQANPGTSSVTVSLEAVPAVDADILVMWYGEGARAAAEAQPLFSLLSAVRRGAYVALEDPVDVWSTSALSVLSIPYGFARFVPRLAEAAARAGGG